MSCIPHCRLTQNRLGTMGFTARLRINVILGKLWHLCGEVPWVTLTEKETLKWESMALERCVTGMAYEMRLVLQGIYEWKDVGVARILFGNWCPWVQAMRAKTGELLKPMARAARMIESHLEGILTHWARGLTTAFMEGLNSLFSAVKRKARGYRMVEYMTTMLYFVAGKLTLPCY